MASECDVSVYKFINRKVHDLVRRRSFGQGSVWTVIKEGCLAVRVLEHRFIKHEVIVH